jgi:hypothetical protein
MGIVALVFLWWVVVLIGGLVDRWPTAGRPLADYLEVSE